MISFKLTHLFVALFVVTVAICFTVKQLLSILEVHYDISSLISVTIYQVTTTSIKLLIRGTDYFIIFIVMGSQKRCDKSLYS